MRAVEGHRAEPLVRDPYAAAFVKAAAGQLPRPMPVTPEEVAGGSSGGTGAAIGRLVAGRWIVVGQARVGELVERRLVGGAKRMLEACDDLDVARQGDFGHCSFPSVR
jgi:hypothetical protein